MVDRDSVDNLSRTMRFPKAPKPSKAPAKPKAAKAPKEKEPKTVVEDAVVEDVVVEETMATGADVELTEDVVTPPETPAEEEAEQEAVVAEDAPPVVVVADDYDPLEGRTTRDLQAIAKELGLNAFEFPTHGGLLTALQAQPRDAVLAADHKRPKKLSDATWLFEKSEDGTLHAVDPQGWWSGTVNPDGSASITLYAPPNALNREHTTPMEGDMTLVVSSLDEFVDRIKALLKGK